ncbi:MAG: hypothetical protein J1E60_02075 [Christensenellaceae bacterium]|nr:hypothetical protein [Christensenellaceae bacterium]
MGVGVDTCVGISVTGFSVPSNDDVSVGPFGSGVCVSNEGSIDEGSIDEGSPVFDKSTSTVGIGVLSVSLTWTHEQKLMAIKAHTSKHKNLRIKGDLLSVSAWI